jgi:hypothetical protein
MTYYFKYIHTRKRRKRKEEVPFLNTYRSVRIIVLVMDLEKTEAINDCAGEGQLHFN